MHWLLPGCVFAWLRCCSPSPIWKERYFVFDPAAGIFGASRVKYIHSGIKLVATDFPLAFAGTVPFLLAQYPLALTAVVAGSIVLILAAVAVLHYVSGPPVSLEFQLLFFCIACVGLMAAYKASGGPVTFQRNAAFPRCFLSSFIASLLNPLSWRQSDGLALSDIAKDPLPLMAAVPARSPDYPDIIVIQHESIFDPRIFGLPVEPIVESFLSPENGLSWKPQRGYFWRRIVAIGI